MRRDEFLFVDPISTDDVLRTVAANRSGGWIVTVNTDILRRVHRDDDFRTLVKSADVAVADGMPIVWAARLSGRRLPGRTAGSDLVWLLAESAAKQGRRIFLLGGNEGVAEQAALILKRKFEGLQIAGTACPPLGFDRDVAYMSSLRDSLVAAKPDVVYVALGSPLQDRVIASLRDALPESWFIGVGIALSYMVGDVRRAPVLLRRVGLEWLFRLVQEPRRLGVRYVRDDLPFALWLLGRATTRRIAAFRGDT
jgi:N-acetylglucosaminyldiphosphoundecaprenol N-acetyl-beta-D-mannosaminyltransferase